MSNYSTRVNDNAYEYTPTTIKQAFDRTIQKVIDSQTSSTILDYINASGSAFGSMGFVNVADAPTTNNEYTVVWFGSSGRITVYAKCYTNNKVYVRDIFNNAWRTNWLKVILADESGAIIAPDYTDYGVDTGIKSGGKKFYINCGSNNAPLIHLGQGIFSQKYGENGYSPVWASTFAQASSKWIKDNIKNIDDNIAKKILELRPVRFDYTNGDNNHYGLIAEEVMKIIPECVEIPEGYNEDSFKPTGDFITDSINAPSIGYANFVPLLIKMIQIQQNDIEELKNKLN